MRVLRQTILPTQVLVLPCLVLLHPVIIIVVIIVIIVDDILHLLRHSELDRLQLEDVQRSLLVVVQALTSTSDLLDLLLERIAIGFAGVLPVLALAVAGTSVHLIVNMSGNHLCFGAINIICNINVDLVCLDVLHQCGVVLVCHSLKTTSLLRLVLCIGADIVFLKLCIGLLRPRTCERTLKLCLLLDVATLLLFEQPFNLCDKILLEYCESCLQLDVRHILVVGREGHS